MSNNSANGSTRAWRRLRAEKLLCDPICEYPQCRKAAVQVDHIRDLKDGGDRWAWYNLRALCADHHKLRHGKRPKPRINPETGMPIE